MINNSLLDNVAITMTPSVSQHVMCNGCLTNGRLWDPEVTDAMLRPRLSLARWCRGPDPSLAALAPVCLSTRSFCPPGPGHQFVGIRAGLHPQTGHHGVWSPRFVPFPPIHIIHSWRLPGPPGGCQQITKVWVILYCTLARAVCSQLRLAGSRLPLWEDKLGLQSSKHQRNQFRNWQWLYLGRVRERDIGCGGSWGERCHSHMSLRTAQTSDNGGLIGKCFCFFSYLNSTCMSSCSFYFKIDIRHGISGRYQGVISGNGQTNEGISGHLRVQGVS